MKVYFIYELPTLDFPTIISNLNNHFEIEDVNYSLHQMTFNNSNTEITDNDCIQYEVVSDDYEIDIILDVLKLGIIFSDITPKHDLDYVFNAIGKSLEPVINSTFIMVYF